MDLHGAQGSGGRIGLVNLAGIGPPTWSSSLVGSQGPLQDRADPTKLSQQPAPITEGAPAMSLTRVHNFSISLDGFGTGEGQSHDAPFGHAGERLHDWMFATRFWREMVGQPGGSRGGGVPGRPGPQRVHQRRRPPGRRRLDRRRQLDRPAPAQTPDLTRSS